MVTKRNHFHFKIATNTLVIMLLFPILSLLINVPGGTKVPVFVGLFSLLYLSRDFSFKKAFFSRPLKIYAVLMTYHFLNAVFLNVPGTDMDVLFTCVLTPVLAMGLTVFMGRSNMNKTIAVLFYTYLVYTALVILVFRTSGIANDEGRIQTATLHPNIIGQYAGFAGVLLSIFCVYRNKSIFFYASVAALPLGVILLTQSRNSISIFALSILIYTIGRFVKSKAKSHGIIILVAIAMLVVPVGQYILDNTDAGKRFVEASKGESMQVKDAYATGTVFDGFLGERIVYYIIGFDNFLDHPVNGIGLWNYSGYNRSEYPLHTEYMVHLAEGGLIGAILYLFFIYSVISSFIKSKAKSNFLYWQLLLSLLVILFVGITARQFPYVQFFPIWGLIIAFLMYNEPGYSNKKQTQYSLNYEDSISNRSTRLRRR
ncbi:O-antigen ligase family protein [Pedobacter faecalis]|uniref:O-antigen ligase family protein n=1 Tax=Pedobacter faecalis TaxID=3041495 RepID=UPI00254DBE9D|nr:O-antigen ligase family protein [Pedobacter sp. ELA7]